MVRREPDVCVPPLPDMDSLGQPAVSHRGLDCYLDSLFDPVLSCGDAVGMGVFADSRHGPHVPSHTRPQRGTARSGGGASHPAPAGDPAKEEGVL